ncbi:hypothetical protein VCCP104417_3381, partial [Vibrio cholerae CP1044(17)]
MLISLQHFSEP